MRKFAKRGLIIALIAVMLVSTSYVMAAVVQNLNKPSEEAIAEMLEDCKATYEGDVLQGTQLYVWAGDRDFDPKENFHPRADLDDEVVEYAGGTVDLTPGVTSSIVYKYTSEDSGVSYKMFPITSVSDRNSATVRSETKDRIIWGVKSEEGYSGYVPADYTEVDSIFEEDKELTVLKGTKFDERVFMLNYDPNKFVVELRDNNVDTSKVGTYKLVYSISPISDADSKWREIYTVNVVDSIKNEGTEIVAGDTAIHATVVDENSCESEVFFGREYNLESEAEKIIVDSGYRDIKGYASVTVYDSNGKEVNKDKVVSSAYADDDKYIINLKNTDGYKIVLNNSGLVNKINGLDERAVLGGWDTNDGEIKVDKDPTKKSGIASMLLGYADSIVTPVKAADTKVEEVTVYNIAHSVYGFEYWQGRKNCIEGLTVGLNTGNLVDQIEDKLLDKHNLQVTDFEDDVPDAIHIHCIEPGEWGYTSVSASNVHATAALYKVSDTKYYVYCTIKYYNSDSRYQTFSNAFSFNVEVQSCNIKVVKETANNVSPKGITFGVYPSKKDANNKTKKILTLTVNKKGIAMPTKEQAKQLECNTSYWVRELKSVDGVFLVDTPKKVTTVANKTVKIKFTDPAWKIKATLVKVDSTNKKLQGAEFTLYEYNKNQSKYKEVGKYTTNGDGVINIGADVLTYDVKNKGKFRIKETKPPEGYKGDFSKDFQISYGTDAVQPDNFKVVNLGIVKNTPLPAHGWIEIHKGAFADSKDYSKEHSLIATFNVFEDQACSRFVCAMETNASGYAKSITLELDSKARQKDFWIKEVNCEEGMSPKSLEAKKVTVYDKQVTSLPENKTNDVGIQEPWFIGAKVTKYDSARDETLSGAEFTFYEWDSRSNKYEVVCTRTTGDDGVAEVLKKDKVLRYKSTNYGLFAVAETKAPEGCVIDNPLMQYFTLDAYNKDADIGYEGDFTDTQFGYLDITKHIVDLTGVEYKGWDLSSATLNIRYSLKYIDDNGKVGDVVPGYDNIHLDSNGHYKSGKLRPGKYLLTETSFNTVLFATSKELAVKVNVYSDNTTYVDGLLGVSIDGKKTWDKSVFEG